MRHTLFILAILLLTSPASVGAGEAGATIIAVRAPMLILWEDPSGQKEIDRIKKSDVKTPLQILNVSENLMLQVEVDGKTGWVFSHHVKTDRKPEITARCDQKVASVETGSARGLGEGCN